MTNERLTEASRMIMKRAREFTESFGHNYVGTHHILLALSIPPYTPPSLALQEVGLTFGKLRPEIQNAGGSSGPETSKSAYISPRAQTLINEMALREALQLGRNYIEPEHILLGLIKMKGGVVGEIFRKFEVDPEDLRRAAIKYIALGPGDPMPTLKSHGTSKPPSWVDTPEKFANVVKTWGVEQAVMLLKDYFENNRPERMDAVSDRLKALREEPRKPKPGDRELLDEEQRELLRDEVIEAFETQDIDGFAKYLNSLASAHANALGVAHNPFGGGIPFSELKKTLPRPPITTGMEADDISTRPRRRSWLRFPLFGPLMDTPPSGFMTHIRDRDDMTDKEVRDRRIKEWQKHARQTQARFYHLKKPRYILRIQKAIKFVNIHLPVARGFIRTVHDSFNSPATMVWPLNRLVQRNIERQKAQDPTMTIRGDQKKSDHYYLTGEETPADKWRPRDDGR